MKTIKLAFLSLAVAGIGFIAAPAPAQAQTFNSAISNPFVFCSLPKPCKYCQPFRRIYEQICPAGTPTAQAQQQYNTAVAANPALAGMTADQFRSQLSAANLSAYGDQIQSLEIDQYITWMATQPGPSGYTTMNDYWLSLGYGDYQYNAALRDTAAAMITQTNQKIVETLSSGYIPSTNLKPWYGITVTNPSPTTTLNNTFTGG